MTTIPNELKIIINTNIPGYQNIEYKPSMTLPNDKLDSSIQFNPLIKLNPSIIKSLPNNIQIREFFDKGLFQSLINSHGLTKQKNLLEATKDGYVDNNIRVTLDTLFPSNGILYVNKQPYAISDLQWSKGDWKINKKIDYTPTLDKTKITDPYLYRTIVEDEIISGDKELKELPSDVVYGPNYTGPLNVVASGITTKDEVDNAEKIEPVPIQTPTPPTVPQPSSVAPNRKYKSIPSPVIIPTPTTMPDETRPDSASAKPYKPTPTPAIEDASSTTVIEPVPGPSTTTIEQVPTSVSTKPYKPTPVPAIEQAQTPSVTETSIKPYKPTPYPAIEPPTSNMDVEEISPSTYDMKLDVSKESSVALQKYFNNPDYFFLVNTIFKNMDENERKFIQKIVQQTTSVNVKSSKKLNKKAYKETVKNINVNKNSGKGDCFFIAVADAINYYNLTATYDANKIIFNNYGQGNMIFTQKMLRELVSYHTLHLNPIEYDEMKEILLFNADTLNESFRKKYEEYKKKFGNKNMSETMLMDIINNIYYSNDNFLIKKPTTITNENIQNPFKIVGKSEIKSFIESSDYWANTIAIDALCDILGLNIIVLEVNEGKLRVPYVYNNNKTYSRYMFLYHENNHYELISFEYQIKKRSTLKTIFDKNETLYPPFSVLFLIFATNYIKIRDSSNRRKYTLLPNIFRVIENAYNKIITNDREKDNIQFIDLFKNYFESFYSEGGALKPYYTPYVSRYVKENAIEPDVKKSNIGYYITINMYLKKGTTLSEEDLRNLKCNHQWNSIRRSYADMRGLNYSILPDYTNAPSYPDRTSNANINANTNSNNSKTQKVRNNVNFNRTRRV
jgi:hypothetical protein